MRAAVQQRARRVARWVFHSRRHFYIALAAAGTGLVILSVLGSAWQATQQTPVPARVAGGPAAASSQQPTVDPTPTSLGEDTEPTLTSRDAAVGIELAVKDKTRAFLQAWMNTDAKDWLDATSAHVHPVLRTALAQTNRGAIPNGGTRAISVVNADPYTADVRALLGDGTVLEIDLAWSGAKWEVIQYQPVRK